VITKLLGGMSTISAERMNEASPLELLPLGVKQILITGDNDTAVPPELGQEYVVKATQSGDDATFILVKDAGHFEVIAPGSKAWPMVEEAVMSELND
jgi:pimeloyl-ACP methyl ester carboxylesterase